jgi:hypothetical protein
VAPLTLLASAGGVAAVSSFDEPKAIDLGVHRQLDFQHKFDRWSSLT